MMRGEGSGENRVRRTSVELGGVRFGSLLLEELVLDGVSPCVMQHNEGGDTGFVIKRGSVDERKRSSWHKSNGLCLFRIVSISK